MQRNRQLQDINIIQYFNHGKVMINSHSLQDFDFLHDTFHKNSVFF